MNKKNMINSVKDPNSINFLKLIAAIQVFVQHTTAHFDLDYVPSWLRPVHSMFSGVPVFFILSGFLIWSSIARTPDIKTFCKKRVFRLYPELWGGVVMSFVAIIVLYGQSIKWPAFLAFQATQSTFMQFWTPDFLRGYGCGTPNGSLWTICVMLQAYLAMWFLHRLIHGKRWEYWASFVMVSVAMGFTPYLVRNILPEILYKLFMQTFVPYFWLFAVGMLICEFFDKWIVYLKRFWYVPAMLALALSVLGWDIVSTYNVFGSMLMAPAMIGFAYACPKLAIKYDISYGIYIYHMIVVNVFIELGYTGKMIYVILALALSVTCAIVSYATLGFMARNKRERIKEQAEKSNEF